MAITDGKKPRGTKKVLISFTPELMKALDKESKKTFGERQGRISMYVEMILRNHLHLAQKHVEET